MDFLFWRWHFQHDRGRKSEIDEKTREEILSLIAHHVTAVNYIYRNTKFDGRVEHRNIRFEVREEKTNKNRKFVKLVFIELSIFRFTIYVNLITLD